MLRLPRYDRPGRWFHVMNRGIARRSVFETECDVRYFLSRVARAVRRGELEVHAFCVMATHFHLLVRSPSGQLSEAMRRIQNEYVRYFNRTRRRDGPLLRGRFLSRPVMSLTYRSILVRYIDRNPVKVRLADAPWGYPHGSTSRYVSGKPPRWLCGDWIMGGVEGTSDADYVGVWGRRPTAAERELVELRLTGQGLAEDPLDDLVLATPARIRAWMVRKACLADETRPGVACVPASTVAHVVDGLKERGRMWRYRSPTGQRRDAWGIAAAGLLRDLSRLTKREIAERERISTAMVTRRIRAHVELCESPDYATRLGWIATSCIRTAFPARRRKVRTRS
jgi:REP element-mobilizing transposase RayT